jgi:hypothetical protein
VKLHKEYVPQAQVRAVKHILRNERRRVEMEQFRRLKALEEQRKKLKRDQNAWAARLNRIGLIHCKGLGKAIADMEFEKRRLGVK